MIGFDRPLRPRWIHESLQIWKPNTPVVNFYPDFNQIAYELTGLEGKRKVRTVLFRYFFNMEGPSASQMTANDSLLAALSHKVAMDDLLPTYLFVLIDSSETLRNVMDSMFRLFPPNSEVITGQLVEKTVERHGERDVAKRATRSFLMTLVHFGILRRKGPNYEWVARLPASCPAIACATTVCCIRQSRMEIDIKDVSAQHGFRLTDLSNIDDCAKRYNGVLWSYVRRPGVSKISLQPDAEEKLRSAEFEL